MRSRSPILAITAVAGITALVACTPDENRRSYKLRRRLKPPLHPRVTILLAGRRR